jgi:hypothetical protein
LCPEGCARGENGQVGEDLCNWIGFSADHIK